MCVCVCVCVVFCMVCVCVCMCAVCLYLCMLCACVCVCVCVWVCVCICVYVCLWSIGKDSTMCLCASVVCHNVQQTPLVLALPFFGVVEQVKMGQRKTSNKNYTTIHIKTPRT